METLVFLISNFHSCRVYPNARESVTHLSSDCSYVKTATLIDQIQGIVTCQIESLKHAKDAPPSQHVNHFSTLANGFPLLPGTFLLDRRARLQDHLAAFLVEEGTQFVRTGGLERDVALRVRQYLQSPLKGTGDVEDYTDLAPSY